MERKKETWKEIEGYKGFQISSKKKVKRDGVLLKPNDGKVRLVKNFKSYIFKVNSLFKNANFE